MQKISGAGNVNNRFVAENVNTGQAPTQITADWMNCIQDELVNVVLAAGLLLDTTNNAQVLAALDCLITNSQQRLLTSLVPVGTCLMLATPIVPLGFLARNGASKLRATYPDLFKALVTDQGFTAQTFTITIGSPAVVTKSAHGFLGGERLRLSTTGSLPTGLNNSADYFVSVVDANSFKLSSSKYFRTFITTTGTQSGVHTYTQSLYGLGDGITTFLLPDAVDMFEKGVNGTTRSVGTAQHGTLNLVDTWAAGFGDVCTLSDVAGTLSTTLSAGQDRCGLDPYVTTDYNTTLWLSAITANAQTLLPGGGVGNFSSGITRPNNIGLFPVIKY